MLLSIKHETSGRAMAQSVSSWLPTAAARLRARVLSSGICGGQSGAGPRFLLVLRFPLPIFISPNRPEVVDLPSGPSLDSKYAYLNKKKLSTIRALWMEKIDIST
jgi:hypothetical protein